MTYDEIIEQLEITKSKIKEIARNEYGGESWNDDLDALTEAADIVADYSKATAQASEMSQKYEQPAMAVRRAAGLYTCPLCGKRTQVGHTHCHWCGKKLSWDREAYADRDYPHMSTKGGYTTNRLIQNGLPVKWHRVKKNRFRVIDIEDFWKWAEKNKSLLDFSRFEKYALGAEPDWVDMKRKADYKKLQLHGQHNAAWTKAEDDKLRYLLEKNRYTYSELAQELRHSEGAIKRRILDLGIETRPVRCPPRKWTEEEVETLCSMVDAGYDFTLIAEKLNRTALATRGKFERLQNPEYNKRYNRGQNRDYEYQGIRSISGKGILKDRKLMDGVEFQELQPATNQ